MTLDDFLERCDNVHPSGNGFVGVCPAHDDREASLGITEGDDGRVLLRCHAGCETPAIVEAMGLKLRDLFANSHASDALPEAIYPYTDEQGDVLFEAVRMPGKKFRQRHLDPENPDAKADGYVWNLDGVRRVPYRLPELLAAVREGHTIVLVEGEKDAMRWTQETGNFATCNPMGAGKWRPEYTSYFIGAKQVIIIQDRDDPGRRHAGKVKEALASIGVAVTVMQAAKGKDASDHFDMGLGLDDFILPRRTPKRGIITAREMAENALEYLRYRPVDLPGYALIPGVEGSVMRQGRLYAGGAYTGDGKTTLALQGTRNICEQGVKTGYFCVTPSQRILTANLQWVPAGDLCAGDGLVGFPEDLTPYQSKLSESKVVATRIVRRKVFRITTDRGSLEASEGHPLVCSRETNGRCSREWVEAQELLPGDRLSFYHPPWDKNDIDAEDRGYLAAAFDGEGCLSNGSLTFYQNANGMSRKVVALLEKYDIAYTVLSRSTRDTLCIRVRSSSAIKLLGIIQPERIDTRGIWENRRSWGKDNTPAAVLQVECLGEQDVVALGTSTLTYISEGFLSHNTLEMSEQDLRNRLIAHKGIPLKLLEQPWLLDQDPEMKALYHLAVEEINDWPLEVIYDTRLKVERVVEEIFDREYEFVVIDHIHRLGFGDRRHLEEQIKTLTNVTLDANIPMLVLCQLRRYQRGKDMVAYPPPVLQDFRETEVLGNEASIAFAVWRQRDQEGLSYQGDASQYRVLKNRHVTGAKDQAGHIELLNFDRATQLYTSGGIYSEPKQRAAGLAATGLPVVGDPWEGSEYIDEDDWS